jgi:hypothetical protein
VTGIFGAAVRIIYYHYYLFIRYFASALSFLSVACLCCNVQDLSLVQHQFVAPLVHG